MRLRLFGNGSKPRNWTMMLRYFVLGLPFLLGLALAKPAALHAQFEPQFHPELDIQPAVGEIEIDGDINDAGWAGAAQASGFTESWPGDQIEPPVQTRVWVTYDEKNLYLAFWAQDDPGKVRATLTDRDQIWDDDYVGIILDTFGTGSWAYEIFLNPLGVQGDLRWSTNGEDSRFDLVFDSKGKVVDDGWQVEAKIPFKSMRFPANEEQSWRATFWRNHPRDSRRRYSWAAMDRDEACWPCQFGTLSGITGVSAGNQLDILPEVTGARADVINDPEQPGASMENIKQEADFGVSVRYGLTSSLAAAGTYNPDFSQVESDAGQINVNTTFALSFPERRPFFQEGRDLFDTWIDQVYTRSINNPLWAAKMTGRMANDGFGVLSAQDQNSAIIVPFEEFSAFVPGGQAISNLMRFKHSMNGSSHVGVLGTDRRLRMGGGNSTLGLDSQILFWQNYRIEAQVVGSYTQEPNRPDLTEGLEDQTFEFNGNTYNGAFDAENFWGYANYVSLERDARRWNFDFDYYAYSPTFRADNGFETQNSVHRTSVWTGLNFYPGNAVLDEWQPSFNVGRVWNWQGVNKDEWFRPQIWWQLKGQTWLSVSYLYTNELFHNIRFDGMQRYQVNLDTEPTGWLQFGFWHQKGTTIARNLDTPVMGQGLDLSVWNTLKLAQNVVMDTSWDYSELDHEDGGENIFAGYIVRSRLQYQFSRRLFMRFVVQYDQFADAVDFEPLLTYRVNPITAFYVGSTHHLDNIQTLNSQGDPVGGPIRRQTARQFFFKIQYLFRS